MFIIFANTNFMLLFNYVSLIDLQNKTVVTFFTFVLRLMDIVCFLSVFSTELFFFFVFRDSVSNWLNY